MVDTPATAQRDGHPQPGLPGIYLERPGVLQISSQLNQAMRSIFLLILWEGSEVRAPEPHYWWFRYFNEELRRSNDLLHKRGGLVVYVRLVNVVMTRYQTTSVLPASSKCLSILPNLHTIQVIHAHTAMTTALKEAFTEYCFPSVRTVYLPEHAHEILRGCINVGRVVCTRGSGGKLVTAIAKAAKRAEELDNFRCDEALMKRIVKAASNLRVIGIQDTQHQVDVTSCSHSAMYLNLLLRGAIRLLSSLKKLTTIEIMTHHSKDESERLQPVKFYMAAAREVLPKQISGSEAK